MKILVTTLTEHEQIIRDLEEEGYLIFHAAPPTNYPAVVVVHEDRTMCSCTYVYESDFTK